jgi:hypothetical protein
LEINIWIQQYGLQWVLLWPAQLQQILVWKEKLNWNSVIWIFLKLYQVWKYKVSLF